jgi:hypothetical protein
MPYSLLQFTDSSEERSASIFRPKINKIVSNEEANRALFLIILDLLLDLEVGGSAFH